MFRSGGSRELAAGPTELASFALNRTDTANQWISFLGSISSTGQAVLFVTRANNLHTPVSPLLDDVFVCRRSVASLRLMSRSIPGGGGNGHTVRGLLTPDGETAILISAATDLSRLTDANDSIDVVLGGVPFFYTTFESGDFSDWSGASP